MCPKDVHILIPQTVNVTIHGKRDVASVTKLRVWGWEIILEYRGGSPTVTRVFIRGRQEGLSQKRRREDGSRGQSNVTTSQGMQAASRSRKRQGNGFSFLDLPRRNAALPISGF